MNAVLRVFIGLIVSILLFIGLVKVENIRPDKYLPPTAPIVVDDMTLRAPGTITDLEERGYSDHFFGGSDFWWYIDYTFTPDVPNVPDNGKFVPGTTVYTGRVRISENDYRNNYKIGDKVTVSYNPYTPILNGVHGTLGGISTTASILSAWLWYPIGILLVGVLIGEFMKRWIKQGDI